MNCKECGVEVKEIEGDKVVPVDENLVKMVLVHKLPFYCEVCGAFKFPYKATRDIVFLLSDQIPEETPGGILIPSVVRDEMHSEYGVVLSVGSGYHDKKGKYHPTELKVGDKVLYDKTVPWAQDIKGADGVTYKVKIMGAGDVKGMVVAE